MCTHGAMVRWPRVENKSSAHKCFLAFSMWGSWLHGAGRASRHFIFLHYHFFFLERRMVLVNLVLLFFSSCGSWEHFLRSPRSQHPHPGNIHVMVLICAIKQSCTQPSKFCFVFSRVTRLTQVQRCSSNAFYSQIFL